MPSYLRLDGGRFGLRVFRDEGPVRLLAFPYAGGQALAYRPLAAALPAGFALAAVDPPGHGFVPGDPHETVDALVEDCLRHVPAEWLDDAVLVGHSMGGYVTLALAAALRAQGRRVRALVLAASRPPHRRGEYTSMASLDDEALFQLLLRMGGMPENPRDARTLFEWGRVPMRADLRAFDAFTPPPPVDVPTLAVGAWDDVAVQAGHHAEWERYTSSCRVELLSGGHLFLLGQAEEYAGRIERFLRAV